MNHPDYCNRYQNHGFRIWLCGKCHNWTVGKEPPHFELKPEYKEG